MEWLEEKHLLHDFCVISYSKTKLNWDPSPSIAPI